MNDCHFDEDAYRLPEGMRRIGYDADTQSYTFRDRSGQLYHSAPGEAYGVLSPVSALSHRRNVTITEIPDPALKEWAHRRASVKAKTFDEILPAGYIGPAQPKVASPTALASPEKLVQAAMPKMQGVVEIVRRHTTLTMPMRRSAGRMKGGSLSGDGWRVMENGPGSREVVGKEDAVDPRLARSKSEMRPPRFRWMRK